MNVYIVHSIDSGEHLFAFSDKDQARAFTEARYGDDPSLDPADMIEECTLIDCALGADMVAAEQEEAKLEVEYLADLP